MTEIIEHIDSLLKEECSRLEIIESLISEFGSDYPDYDYTKWREIVKARIEETVEKEEEEDTSIYVPQINVVSIQEKYDRAQKQANYLLGWLEKKREPIQTWSMSTTNRWARIYLECQSVLASLDDDFACNMISNELYLTCKSLLEKVSAIYATIPQDKLLKSSLSINQKAVLTKLSTWRLFKQQLQYIQFPINIQRRIAVDMPLNREDIHNYVLLAAEEKDYYSYSDLFVEKMSRIYPLLDSEEYEYFKRYREGDVSARDAIIEALMPTLIARIKAYCHNHCEFLFDDLLQDSILTVLEAFKYYHISRYSSFKSYAMACVNYSINTNASKLCPLKTKVPQKSDYTFKYDPLARNTYWGYDHVESDTASPLGNPTNTNNSLVTVNDEIDIEQPKSIVVNHNTKRDQEEVKEQRKQERIKRSAQEIEKQIIKIIQPRLNELPLPQEVNRKYNYLGRLISETRKVIKKLDEWVILKGKYPLLELMPIDGIGNILLYLDKNLLVLKNSSVVSARTLEELETNITRLRKLCSSS